MESTPYKAASKNSKNQQEQTSTNYYQAITNRVIRSLEQGIIPWRRSTHIPFHDFAQNYYSSRVYRGINWALLNLLMPDAIPYYLTWNQVQTLGGSVLKGTKSKSVFSFNTYYKTPEGRPLAVVQAKQLQVQQESVQRISFWKRHQVFNIEQTQGFVWQLPDVQYPKTPVDLLNYLANQKEAPSIQYYELEECYYDPKADELIFPHNKGNAVDRPYLLFVNLINWTGHKNRLSRSGITQTPSDCSYDVAEQFIADMGASFLCRLVQLPLPCQVANKQGGEILALWIQTLEEDNRFFFRVATKVQEAVEYLLN